MNDTPTPVPADFLWEGTLIPTGGTYAPKSSSLPRVSIGKPIWWDNETVLGKDWLPPASGVRYGMARFAFSLRPEGRQEIRRVELTVYLHAKGGGPHPVFFDLYPRGATEEQTGTVAAGIGPEIKVPGGISFSLAKLEASATLRDVAPVVTADGIGENTARWVWQTRPAHPLIGSQIVYGVIETPPSVETARASLLLTVEVASVYGPIRGILPEAAREYLSWLLE